MPLASTRCEHMCYFDNRLGYVLCGEADASLNSSDDSVPRVKRRTVIAEQPGPAESNEEKQWS